MSVDETKFPDRVSTSYSEAQMLRKIQNSSAGATSRSYSISDKSIMVMVCEMDREWTPEEYITAVTALKTAAPVDSVPAMEQVKIVTPNDVPATDTCTLYVTAHPRLAEIVEEEPPVDPPQV